MTRRKKCRPSQHADQPMRGTQHVRCTACGDEYPCDRLCDHLDCRAERGDPMPEGVTHTNPAPRVSLLQQILDRGAVVQVTP